MISNVLMFINFESFQDSVFFTIFISVISSFIFLFILLYTMRPKIKISNYICNTKMAPENNYWFVFKIVNKSWFYTYDVNIRLDKIEPVVVNNGKKINHRIVNIETSSDYINHLPRMKYSKGEGDHAYLIRTKCNIRKDILNNDVIVVLTITSKHGLTNLTRVVTKEFLTTDVIKKDKEFKFGKYLTVV